MADSEADSTKPQQSQTKIGLEHCEDFENSHASHAYPEAQVALPVRARPTDQLVKDPQAEAVRLPYDGGKWPG